MTLSTLEPETKILDIKKEEASEIGKDPFKLIEHGFLTIKTKKDGLQKLIPNFIQKKFLASIRKALYSGKPVRILILKARQAGLCGSPNMRVLTSDLRWISLRDIQEGQEIICTDEFPQIKKGNRKKSDRKMRTGFVVGKKSIFETAYKLKMDDGRELVLTPEHRMLSVPGKPDGCKRTETIWRKAKDFEIGNKIRYITDVWGESNFEDGWFGGMIDGEGTFRYKGSHSGAEITVCQIPGNVFNNLLNYAGKLSYNFNLSKDARRFTVFKGKEYERNRPTDRIEFSRMNEIFKLLGQTRPIKHIGKKWWEGKSLPGKNSGIGWSEVVGIEKLKKQEMIDLQTSEKTFIMEGFVSHNSTVVEAIIYAFTSRMKGINACVISDDLDGSNYIFEMQKLYHEYLDEHLKPQIKHSNEKKLSFSNLNSQILIETADNANVGRKFTFQFVHGTEVSRWTSSLSEIMAGLGHAVPFAPGTMIFLETTANGYEEFYDLWVKAINGKTDWVPLFYPWFEIPENVLPLVNKELYPIENINFVTPAASDNFLKEESRLKLEYKLTDEQLNWRRWDIVNNCSGDMNKFNEDNPACWQDAFVATGDLFFDREALKTQLIKKPLFVGNIVKEEFKYIFREDETGLFKIYERPERDGQYIVGGDPAEGLEHGDKSGAVVINKRTNKTVCIYNHNIPPERFSFDLMLMGEYYNKAIIACESKGYGASVNQDLYKHYGNIYRRIKTSKGFKQQTMEIGFLTSPKTRPTILAQLAEEILCKSTELLDVDLIGQCWTFINNVRKGKPEADVGKSDDLVMARAIAAQVRVEKPYRDASLMMLRKKPKRFKGLSGY